MKEYQMPIAKNLKELKLKTLEELEEEHDEVSKSTQICLDYYLNEIRYRENSRIAKSMFYCTIIIGIFTLVCTVATVTSLLNIEK